jgi:hypothetical protein
MSFNERNTSPWQVGPVSSLGRIAAAALVALALDALFIGPAVPPAAVPLLLALVPSVVAIRVARGLDRSLAIAAFTFALIGGASATGLMRIKSADAYANAPIVVAVILCTVGFVAGMAGWIEQRRLGSHGAHRDYPPDAAGAHAGTHPSVDRASVGFMGFTGSESVVVRRAPR